ncbi:hypothetical protein NX786_28660 [Telluria mixta]|uniref:Fibronectin n=1 Tax=Telluria mixta TaxID=34071 RepID=A0ABT2C945_9BURK|nr:hypothetical protein [Telluria mixta]MCS0633316.1 hypothetical protein [Telluria mixta]WEM94796.1 hypothetical protein P0M04_25360 [Telluria mixta]
MTARRWLAALLLTASTLVHAGDTRPGPRAIWIWEGESYAMLEDDAAARTAIAFLKDKAIGTAYVYADAYEGRNLIATQPGRYRTLVRRMHAAGLKVQALLGSGYLHTERYLLPEHRRAAQAMLQRVLDYNAAAAPDERFDGISLDIEPHILDAWATSKMELLGDFLDMSDALVRQKNAVAPGLPMGPAIPFWYDGIQVEWKGRRRPMNEHVQDLYDTVALMDYRDHAEGGDGIVSHARDELDYAARIGKPVVIGVETMPNAIRKVSFHHLREGDMERELAETARAVAGLPGFGGFAIHHYAAYRRWLGAD